MHISQRLHGGALVGAAIFVTAGVMTYAGTHKWSQSQTAASALLATASGVIWIVSAVLPRRLQRMSARLSIAAATLAALSGVCLLP